MLCDTIAEWLNKAEPSLPDVMALTYREFLNRVNQAQRFVLDRDAVMTIQSISESSPQKFLDALPLCRLPYPKMWIEFSFYDRMLWMKEAQTRGLVVDAHDHASPPARLGFLLEQMDDEGRVISILPAWHHRDHDEASICHLNMVINTGGESDDLSAIRKTVLPTETKKTQNPFHRWMTTVDGVAAAIALEGRMREDVPEFMISLWNMILQSPETTEKVIDLARYDLKSEWRFVLGLLIVLNSRNIIEVGDFVDISKINKARERSRKPLMFSHRVIRLNLSRVQKQRLRGSNPTDLQKHLVKGHLKMRKSGLFWWMPFVRGNVGEAKITTTHVKG